MNDTVSQDVIYQLCADPTGWWSASASGLYRSTDQGKSWHPAYASLGGTEPLTTLALAVASGGNNRQLIFAGLSGGLLRSSDAGASWERLPLPDPEPVFTALAASPDFHKDGKLFAGTLEDGVLIYLREGRAWANWNFGLLDRSVYCLAISPNFSEDQMVFAGVQTGVFFSINGGRSWTEAGLPGDYDAAISLAISPNFSQDGVVYAGMENQGLLVSHDRGESWKSLALPRSEESVNSILLAPDFSARQELVILLGGEPLYSADGGVSWSGWREDVLTGRSVTALTAPSGFSVGAPVLVGLADGKILSI